jgi:hypothetical protein
MINEPAVWHGGIKTELRWWGELHYGSMRDLQEIGIGVGKTFPVSQDGRRTLRTLDPRGFQCRIMLSGPQPNSGGEAIFLARIEYPGRDGCSPPSMDFAHGVVLVRASHANTYKGSMASLEAAGLVKREHFPGAPGMSRTCVRILPGGEVLQPHPPSNLAHMARAMGAKCIERTGKQFLVTQYLSYEETQERSSAEKQAWLALEKQWEKGPRPRSLFDDQGNKRVVHLRMISSHNGQLPTPRHAERPSLRLVQAGCRVSP